jgi:AhpD family alkylhydroperoxidase
MDSQRIEVAKVRPEVLQALLAVHNYAESSKHLEPSLRHLVKLRVSQINGCAYCVDLHSREARRDGEDQRRLDLLPVWREASLYTPRERAAFEWAESVTLLSENHVPDDVYKLAVAEFGEAGLVDLTMAVIAINSWNRVAVPFRKALD